MHQPATNKQVCLHFQGAGHRLEADAIMLPIMKLKSENVWVRKALEKKFINEHDMIDSGLNKCL